ncbi:DUF3052 domain-containing protein [Kitasatospora sp. NPDC058965]|uniref:DUF3052 domain-containing protein n=1 Tax=Kitasatospora sp. NPDC058965 TaxID=3346682 RepID=UPI0036BCB9DF
MTDSGRTGHAGYSGTPLAKKLRIKPGHRVALWRAPQGWALPDLPDGVLVSVVGEGGDGAGPGSVVLAEADVVLTEADVVLTEADVVLAFHRSAEELRAAARPLVDALRPASCLWMLWPRRAAGHRSDLTDTLVRETLLPFGVVDVKVAAVGEDWSGLAFVWRKENRPG